MPSKYGVRIRQPNPEASHSPSSTTSSSALAGQVEDQHPQQPQRAPPARAAAGRARRPRSATAAGSPTAATVSADHGRGDAPAGAAARSRADGLGRPGGARRGRPAQASYVASMRRCTPAKSRLPSSESSRRDGAARRAARGPRRRRAARPSRGRSGAAGRSRRRPGPPPRAGAGTLQRPVHAADLEHEDAGGAELRPRGRPGSSSRCRRRGSARRPPAPAAAGRVRRRWRRPRRPRGPESNQCSAARSMLAAHTWNRTGSSSKVTSPSSSSSRCCQRPGGVDVGAGGDRAAHRAQRPVAVHLPAVLAGAAPQVGEPLDDRRARVPGDHRAVERADAGAEDQVGGDRRARGAPAACRPRPRRGRPRRRARTRSSPGSAASGGGSGDELAGARRAPAAVARCSAQKIRTGQSRDQGQQGERQRPAGPAGEQERLTRRRSCRASRARPRGPW